MFGKGARMNIGHDPKPRAEALGLDVIGEPFGAIKKLVLSQFSIQ